jgi:hypothetical protein
MPTVHDVATAGKRRRNVIGTLLLVAWTALSLQAQNASYPPHKASPPRIESQIVLLDESVVQTQWAHTLELVNAPQNLSLLNPGQCIRVGIYSTGDSRDAYLKNVRLSFKVQFAGRSDSHPLAAPSEFKQIKLEGGDFVAAALSAGGVEQPANINTTASLGASAEHWCAPVDAADGSATVEAEVESPSSHQTLKSSTIQIEGFETGSKRSFKNIEELGTFSQTYYRQPNPARLLPALQFMVANQTQSSSGGQAEILAAFLSAALNSAPSAAQDFQRRIAAQPPLTRAFGLLILRSAGYDIGSVLNTLSPEEQQKFLSLSPLQDPFDLTPTQQLFQHLDMMWAVFGATGQFKPVNTIASALSWRADYEDFDKLRKTPNHPSTLTPSIVRGVVYTAAGWSLSSFQSNDPLVADYIDYMRASPDTPQSVKLELAGLASNPAFKRPRAQ